MVQNANANGLFCDNVTVGVDMIVLKLATWLCLTEFAMNDVGQDIPCKRGKQNHEGIVSISCYSED